MPGEDYQSWSTTADNNGNADSLIYWQEGMARARVNNSARSEMAAHAKNRNLLNGSIVTTGSPDAQAFASGVGYTVTPANLRVMLKIGAGLTNTGAVTLNMDAIGDVAIKNARGAALAGGDLLENSYREFLWNGTEWILLESTVTQTVLINTVTIETVTPVATVDFTANIDDKFLEYRFILTAIIPELNMTRLRLRVSTDAGVTWKSAEGDYRGIRSDTYSNDTLGPTYYGTEFYRGHFSQTNLELSHSVSNVATRPMHGEMTLMAPYLVSQNPMRWELASWDGSYMNYTEGAGIYFGNGPINGIRFMMETGNIAGGIISMYGVGRRVP